MGKKFNPKEYEGGAVALAFGGPIGGAMRQAGDLFSVEKGQFSQAWMRPATEAEAKKIKADHANNASAASSMGLAKEVVSLKSKVIDLEQERDDVIIERNAASDELEQAKLRIKELEKEAADNGKEPDPKAKPSGLAAGAAK